MRRRAGCRASAARRRGGAAHRLAGGEVDLRDGDLVAPERAARVLRRATAGGVRLHIDGDGVAVATLRVRRGERAGDRVVLVALDKARGVRVERRLQKPALLAIFSPQQY